MPYTLTCLCWKRKKCLPTDWNICYSITGEIKNFYFHVTLSSLSCSVDLEINDWLYCAYQDRELRLLLLLLLLSGRQPGGSLFLRRTTSTLEAPTRGEQVWGKQLEEASGLPAWGPGRTVNSGSSTHSVFILAAGIARDNLGWGATTIFCGRLLL